MSDSSHGTFRRRTLVAGAAWSVPVVAFGTATPAMAASPGECDPEGTLYDATGTGKLLSGSIAGVDLDNVASVDGATASVDASTPAEAEATNPLQATVLNSIQLGLTGLADTLSDILDFNTDTGVLNQYGYAHEDGTVRGASGAVADNGTIRLEPGEGWPELATLQLSEVVEEIGGSAASDFLSLVADADLSIGAVAGRTAFNSLCNPPVDLERDYLVAYLKTILTSPTIGATVETVNATLDGLTSGLVDTLNDLPALGLLASVDSLSLSLDTAQTPAGTGRPVQIALENPATVTVDLGALLGGAYSGTTASPWLNSLAPNTRLFVDAPLPADAAAIQAGVLTEALLDAIRIDIQLDVLLSLVDVTVTGSVGDLVSGEATVEPELLGLTSAILTSIGTVIREAILEAGALTPITSAVTALLQSLFTILEDVVVLTLNAQNQEPGAVPDDLAALPDGQYDVAALHIGALDAAGLDLLDVLLGRGSGGPNTVRA
ncbi:choice-of-anchor G family protein [Brachybacterium saurashtrense]|nr:choice-of-anchor G family protein [Brachybacterium saurashtrense]